MLKQEVILQKSFPIIKETFLLKYKKWPGN